MPIKCPDGSKPRYRWTVQAGKKVRLAFCGKRVVERKVKGGQAKKIKKGRKKRRK